MASRNWLTRCSCVCQAALANSRQIATTPRVRHSIESIWLFADLKNELVQNRWPTTAEPSYLKVNDPPKAPTIASIPTSYPEEEDIDLHMEALQPTSDFLSRIQPPSTTTEDPLLYSFSRNIMKDGKLSTAQAQVNTMLNLIRDHTNDDPLPLLRLAVSKAAPLCRNVSQRQTATKRVTLPLALNERQRVRQVIMWIVKATEKRERAEKSFGKRLGLEVLSVLDGSSDVLKKRDEVHRLAMLAKSNVGKDHRGRQVIIN